VIVEVAAQEAAVIADVDVAASEVVIIADMDVDVDEYSSVPYIFNQLVSRCL
jgi:hypothetical protein